MSKDNRCVICKHLDILHSSHLEFSLVYKEGGGSVRVLLCRRHEVELFKLGQKKFFLNYNQILLNVLDSHEVEFMKLLSKTVQKHMNEIY